MITYISKYQFAAQIVNFTPWSEIPVESEFGFHLVQLDKLPHFKSV